MSDGSIQGLKRYERHDVAPNDSVGRIDKSSCGC